MEVLSADSARQLEAIRTLFLEYYHFILANYGVDMGYEYFQGGWQDSPESTHRLQGSYYLLGMKKRVWGVLRYGPEQQRCVK